MAEEEVITLDSDDEDTNSSSNVPPSLLSNGGNSGITIKRIPAAPKVIPRIRAQNPGPSGMHPLPLPPGMGASPLKKPQVPKKPGVFPPFALFSQEQRPEILRIQPDIGFAEIGRKLGEMWHALSEAEKEQYRSRARAISDKKLKEYEANIAKLPPRQRQMAMNAANAPSKKRKTHGFAIFSSEMRKNLGNAMSPQETANVIAESWRSASPSVRREYEERAARFNSAQAKLEMMGQQQQQRRALNNSQMVQGNRFNNASASGLRISSVSSLSPQAKKRPNMVHNSPAPLPLPPPPAASLGPKLPSGITISRVEPEVSIVQETAPVVHHQPAPSGPRLPIVNNRGMVNSRGMASTRGMVNNRGMLNNRGRGGQGVRRPAMSPAAQAAMRVKAQLRANGVNMGQPMTMGMPRGPAPNPNIMNRRGRPYLDGQGLPVYSGGMKRMAPRVVGMPPKRMRASPITPNILEQRLCRSCGCVNPVGCKLSDRSEIIQALSELTMTTFDLVKDQMEGYPSDICRRCMSSIQNFILFKKAFVDGQVRLKQQFGAQNQAMASVADDSIAADPSEETNHQEIASVNIEVDQGESILPDLDLEMDFGENPANIPQPVDIKQEKVRVLSPNSLEKITIKEEIGKPMISENIVKNEGVDDAKGKDNVKPSEDPEVDPFASKEKEKSPAETDPFLDSKEKEKTPEDGGIFNAKEKEKTTEGVDPFDAKEKDETTEETDPFDAKEKENTQTGEENMDPFNEKEDTDQPKDSEKNSEEENMQNGEESDEKETDKAIHVNGGGGESNEKKDDPLNWKSDSDRDPTIDEDSQTSLNGNTTDMDMPNYPIDEESNMDAFNEDSNAPSEAMNEDNFPIHEDMSNDVMQNDEESNGVVPEMEDTQATENGSFISCGEDTENANTNISNQDPFEEAFTNTEERMDITTEGSQDANDAFEEVTTQDNINEEDITN